MRFAARRLAAAARSWQVSVMSFRNRAKRAYRIAAGSAKRIASRQLSRFAPAPVAEPLICVGMVRNERDIIDVWLAHLLALFDRIIIIDHLSTDGTRERLHEVSDLHPALEVRHHDDEAYIQADLMTALFTEISSIKPDGWLFFLDADEFLMVASRKALAGQLALHRRAVTVRSVWTPAYPVDLNDNMRPETRLRGWHDAACINSKVAVNLTRAEEVARVDFGNHNLIYHRTIVLRNLDLFRILHVPIRAERQLGKKLDHGVPSVSIAHPTKHYARHWTLMTVGKASESPRLYAYNYGCYDLAGLSTVPPPPETIDATLGDLVPLHPGALDPRPAAQLDA